jgi:hypothetical protein
MEAALRYASEKIVGKRISKVDFKEVRGMEAVKDATLDIAGNKVNVAIVHGLQKAKELIEAVKNGKVKYDFVEVMACPGGCISGGGQPIARNDVTRKVRAKGLYNADKQSQLHKSQDNYMVERCYDKHLGGAPGSHEAHEALHTSYRNRSQLFDAKVPVLRGKTKDCVEVCVTICAQQDDCPGQKLLGLIVDFVKSNDYADLVNIDAAFSSRPEADGTVCVTIGDHLIDRCNFINAENTEEQLQNHVEFEHIKQAIQAEVAK